MIEKTKKKDEKGTKLKLGLKILKENEHEINFQSIKKLKNESVSKFFISPKYPWNILNQFGNFLERKMFGKRRNTPR